MKSFALLDKESRQRMKWRSVTAPLLLLVLPMSPVRAQDATTAAPSQKAPVATATARARRQETLKQIAARLSETTSLRILADSMAAPQPLVAPDGAVTADTIEDYLTRLTRRLPAGSAWYKVYLPASGDNKPFTADAVAQFAQAQRKLLGRSAPGTVEIQGKVMTVAEAASVIQTLGLKPVYVITGVRQAGMAALASGLLSGSGTTEFAAELMSALTKQLGVANVENIPPGSYKVSLPGPDGSPQEANIEVSNTDGKRRIAIRMGTVTAP